MSSFTCDMCGGVSDRPLNPTPPFEENEKGVVEVGGGKMGWYCDECGEAIWLYWMQRA